MVTETLGFIGLGNMGRPMAANLAAAGFRLSLHDKAGSRGGGPRRTLVVRRDGVARAEVARQPDQNRGYQGRLHGQSRAPPTAAE